MNAIVSQRSRSFLTVEAGAVIVQCPFPQLGEGSPVRVDGERHVGVVLQGQDQGVAHLHTKYGPQEAQVLLLRSALLQLGKGDVLILPEQRLGVHASHTCYALPEELLRRAGGIGFTKRLQKRANMDTSIFFIHEAIQHLLLTALFCMFSIREEQVQKKRTFSLISVVLL